ncbi:p21-activated protein kinase-interacting protein 1-like [Rhopilema esculentum]|uniref:p21-activated protein kinase-interacting protein 1-like n=1 Tax=Rhopilema esculentum TaxID=499914 RepID=UPI0031D71E59
MEWTPIAASISIRLQANNHNHMQHSQIEIMGSVEVIVGTYNHVLIGIRISNKEESEKEWEFTPSFTDQGHDGCIKTVASGGKYLASGSTDETIRLYNLKKHVELGSLVQQSGSITSLAFSGNTHMLSASEDGTISIWKCKSWDCVKTLKGHRDAVTSISIHPSGRLALSVSKDKTIRTWNLLTGRSAYTTNIKQVGELVNWSPGGECYVVASGSKATVYKISEPGETCVISCDKSILCMEFISENVLLLAGELDEIIVYDIKDKKQLQTFKAHEIRVKSVKSVKNPLDEKRMLVFTVASDGSLRAWNFNIEDWTEKPEMLTEIHLPGRPVCMTVSTE